MRAAATEAAPGGAGAGRGRKDAGRAPVRDGGGRRDEGAIAPPPPRQAPERLAEAVRPLKSSEKRQRKKQREADRKKRQREQSLT